MDIFPIKNEANISITGLTSVLFYSISSELKFSIYDHRFSKTGISQHFLREGYSPLGPYVNLQIRLRDCPYLGQSFVALPGGSAIKESACNVGDLGLLPGLEIPWRRAWQPTPLFLHGESHGQGSLVGNSPWGHKESDRTDQLISLFSVALGL